TARLPCRGCTSRCQARWQLPRPPPSFGRHSQPPDALAGSWWSSFFVPVVGHVGAEPVERAAQAFGHVDARLPSGCLAEGGIVCVIVADVDLLAPRREWLEHGRAAAVGGDQCVGQLRKADRREAADVESAALGG